MIYKLPTGLNRYIYGLDITFVATLFVVLILIILFIRQRSKYIRLRDIIRRDLRELKRQKLEVGDLEKNIKKSFVAGSLEDLEHWSRIEKELNKLVELPNMVEDKDKIILNMHISQLKKDYIDVTATDDSITVSINPKKGLPIQCSYKMPKKIDPSKLSVTYKGNTLEIHALKFIPEEK